MVFARPGFTQSVDAATVRSYAKDIRSLHLSNNMIENLTVIVNECVIYRREMSILIIKQKTAFNCFVSSNVERR